MGYLIWQTMRLMKSRDNGHTHECVSREWKVVNVVQRALNTFLHFECSECNMTTTFTSHPNTAEPNYLFTAGTMSAGVPFDNIEEIFKAIGMPCMDRKTFNSYQRKVTVDLFNVAQECMKETAEKEKKIALEKGRVIDGIPCVTIISDASWSKRSLGGRYDSSGNCTVIIGYETGEILDIAVKNKNCAICDTAEKEHREPRDHICYKNYDKSASSGGMEHVGTAELCSVSVSKYGLIYDTLIGDGDSNVIYKIHQLDPYAKHNVKVRKMQCVVHLVKNVVKKSRKVATIVGGIKYRGGPYRKARSI